MERYQRVWMIDVRDSFFQSDPFSFVTEQRTASSSGGSSNGAGLHVFSGVESFPIKECGWNSGWIKDCFGAQVLNSVGSKVISFSVFSSAQKILIFYASFTRELFALACRRVR